jgi:hypothetical protein
MLEIWNSLPHGNDSQFMDCKDASLCIIYLSEQPFYLYLSIYHHHLHTVLYIWVPHLRNQSNTYQKCQVKYNYAHTEHL